MNSDFSLGVTEHFCHTSNEISTISISRFQNDQNIQGKSMNSDFSLGVTFKNLRDFNRTAMSPACSYCQGFLLG